MSERVAVITGGAGDLAGAIATELRQGGWTVQAPHRSALDVTSPESVLSFFGEMKRVDLLINNAGSCADRLCAQMSEADWDRVIATNLRGAFLCSQAASLKMMAQRTGHIINIGSFSARFGNAGQTNYVAAKAGLIGLTQSMARELGRRNVRVNCVLPGFLETKFTADMLPAAKQQVLQAHVLRKFNNAEEAGRFVAFLDGMSLISGQVFQLDSRIAPWT